jgi:hypothetical protein
MEITIESFSSHWHVTDVETVRELAKIVTFW